MTTPYSALVRTVRFGSKAEFGAGTMVLAMSLRP